MGSTGTTQVMLEFQVRLNGKPMNPRLVLPKK
jgi:lipoprotein NlpD